MIVRAVLAAVTALIFTVACTPQNMSTLPASNAPRSAQAAAQAVAGTVVAPATFAIFPSLVTGGAFGGNAVGYITVASPSSVDRTVQITSSNPAVAMPFASTIPIPAGANGNNVEIITPAVSQVTAATLTVSGAGVSKSFDVTIYPTNLALPPAILASVAMTPLTVPAGSPSTATVTLTSPAPAGGLVVLLWSNLVLTAQIQPTVTVPAGARTVSVPVMTSIGFPNSTTTPTIEAGALDNIVHTGLNVVTGNVPKVLGIASVALNPLTIIGGNTVQGTVTLNLPAPSGGALITLVSTDTTVATTPASVTIPAGATSATFPIATSVVSAATSSNIAGGFAGGFLTTTLHVNPAATTAPPPPPPVATPVPTAVPAPPASLLTAPSLISPAADTRLPAGSAVSFDWNDVAAAASYTIQVSNTDKFSSFVVNQTVPGSTFSSTTLPTSQLVWRVRANSASGTAGAWSATRRLELK